MGPGRPSDRPPLDEQVRPSEEAPVRRRGVPQRPAAVAVDALHPIHSGDEHRDNRAGLGAMHLEAVDRPSNGAPEADETERERDRFGDGPGTPLAPEPSDREKPNRAAVDVEPLQLTE